MFGGGAAGGGPGGAGGGGGFPSPAAMQSMMSHPAMQALLSNPALIQSLMQSNPTLRALTEANPGLAAALNDPGMLREAMSVMSNPSLMREHMRNQDRALSNIEGMPGGFNALRQLYESVQVRQGGMDKGDQELFGEGL
jgi:ubiquilin